MALFYEEFERTSGQNLEKAISFVAYNWKNSKGNLAVDTTGTSKDTEEGTDFEILGVRCDITCNPEKTHTEWLPEKSVKVKLDDVDNVTVRFGMRTANGVVEFETPVLIFLFQSKNARYLYSKFDIFCDELLKNFSNLIDVGMDVYWDYIDAHPQYEI